MKSSTESKNVNLKPLIKQILLHYIKQKQFKKNILEVFHRNFELVPFTGSNNKVRRSLVHRTMRNELRLGFYPGSTETQFLKEVLRQSEVKVVKIEGIKYYKGLRAKEI